MDYPAAVIIDRPERIANWRPIGHMILVLPHYVILYTAWNIAVCVTATVAWFSVLATGRVPPGIAAFHATYVRYRVRTFAYMRFLTDKFPPFDFAPSFEDPGGAGTSVSVSPRLEGKNRLNVLFRFVVPFTWLSLIGTLGFIFGFASLPLWVWIIQITLGAVLVPAAFFSAFRWVFANVAGVLGLFVVILTGRWPEGLYRFAAGWVRVDARLWAYSLLLTDDYPPFSID